MDPSCQKDFDSILEKLKDTNDELQKNLEVNFFCIENFKLGDFDELLDLRTVEEFDNDNIIGSHNFPCLTTDNIETLSTIDQTVHRVTLISQICSALSTKLQEVLEGRSRECKILLVCRNGGIVSETVSAAMMVAKYKPYILKDGYLSYRKFLADHFHNEDSFERVAKYRFVSITGPENGGKDQFVDTLMKENSESSDNHQILNIDSLLEDSPSQNMFESRLFHTLMWRFTTQKVKQSLFYQHTFLLLKVVWVVFTSNRNLEVPKNLTEKILKSARIHIDVDLNNRLEFILEEYDYILKDEKDIKSMLEKIDNYVDRKDDFSWSSLIESSKYKDLVLACRDVHGVLSSLSKSEEMMKAFLFFIAPKIDFRQSCLPNFLKEFT